MEFLITLISCPSTASGPVPTTLSQKARPEGATVSSHGAVWAATLGCACKNTSRRLKQKPKPIASLLPNKGEFSFICSGRGEELSWWWLKILILDSATMLTLLANNLPDDVLSFMGVQYPRENANELISTTQYLEKDKSEGS